MTPVTPTAAAKLMSTRCLYVCCPWTDFGTTVASQPRKMDAVSKIYRCLTLIEFDDKCSRRKEAGCRRQEFGKGPLQAGKSEQNIHLKVVKPKQ